MSKRNIVHLEIAAQSRPDSAKFYADVFGWDFQHMEEPALYTMMTTGNMTVGLPDIGEEYRQGDVIVYVESDDLAADLEHIERAGGKRLSQVFPVGNFGEMAFFSDPTGNRLALWKAYPMPDAT